MTPTDGLSGLAPRSFLVAGSSNEPDNATGEGNTAPDVVISGGVVQLRAEPSGSSNGRIYTVTATAADVAGNVANSTSTCAVPHDQRKR